MMCKKDTKDEVKETKAIEPNIQDIGEHEIQCLPIIGQVEGHMMLTDQTKTTKYEHVLPLLMAIENNPEVKGFVLILNTMGGDVEAGLAISEMISGMSTPSVSLVLGGGHSIGVSLLYVLINHILLRQLP